MKDTDDADDTARQQGLLPNSVAELQVLTCAFAVLDLASQGAASAKFHAHLAVSPPQMCKPKGTGIDRRQRLVLGTALSRLTSTWKHVNCLGGICRSPVGCLVCHGASACLGNLSSRWGSIHVASSPSNISHRFLLCSHV